MTAGIETKNLFINIKTIDITYKIEKPTYILISDHISQSGAC